MSAFEGELAGQKLGHVGNHLAPALDELDVQEGARRFGIAEVREQADPLGLDDDGDVRADEAGQVAHIGGGGDDQRLLELRDQFFGAGVHLPSARYSSASRYPSGPLPITRFLARSEMTDFRRHSSRASMFERWTSTTGTSKSSTASRSA